MLRTDVFIIFELVFSFPKFSFLLPYLLSVVLLAAAYIRSGNNWCFESVKVHPEITSAIMRLTKRRIPETHSTMLTYQQSYRTYSGFTKLS